MKSESDIRKRLETLEDWCAKSDSGTEREMILMSAIDELRWVLRT